MSRGLDVEIVGINFLVLALNLLRPGSGRRLHRAERVSPAGKLVDDLEAWGEAVGWGGR
jgi:hypothetical protein